MLHVVTIVRQVHPIKKYKVRDHGHLTGKYRGAPHNRCNIDYFNNIYLPVFFHSLKSHDGHLFFRKAFKINQEIRNKRISTIPNSEENVMSFTLGEKQIY